MVLNMMDNDENRARARALIDEWDVSTGTFAKLTGTSKTSLEYWFRDGAMHRDLPDSHAIVLEFVTLRPELRELLFARYERIHGEPPPRKGERRAKKHRAAR